MNLHVFFMDIISILLIKVYRHMSVPVNFKPTKFDVILTVHRR